MFVANTQQKNNIFCNLKKFKHKIYYLYFTLSPQIPLNRYLRSNTLNLFHSGEIKYQPPLDPYKTKKTYKFACIEFSSQRRTYMFFIFLDKYLGANTLNLFRSGATKYLSPLIYLYSPLGRYLRSNALNSFYSGEIKYRSPINIRLNLKTNI